MTISSRFEDHDTMTAPVCVCQRPEPDTIGQCSACGRPHHPDNAAFMAIRFAWRTSGIDCEPDYEPPPTFQLSMFPAIAPDVRWP